MSVNVTLLIKTERLCFFFSLFTFKFLVFNFFLSSPIFTFKIFQTIQQHKMDFILPAMAISGIALISLVSWSIIYFRRRNHPKPFYISDNTNNDYCNQDMIYEPLLSSSKQSREIEHINKSFANYGSSSLSTSHSSSQQQNLAVSPRHPVPGLLGSLDHPGSSSPIMGFHSPQSSNNLYTPLNSLL